MQFEKTSRTVELECEINSKLSNYLRSLYNGRPATPRSWLYEHTAREALLHKCLSLVRQANKGSKLGNEFNQFEEAYLPKFGPQGEIPPLFSDECMEVLDPCFAPSDWDEELALQHLFPKAKDFAREIFGSSFGSKRRKSFERVIDDMRERDTLSTSSGFPRMSRRSTVRDEEIADAISGKAFDYPAILLFRQYRGKLRPVWMYPMSMNLLEYQYTQVIQEALRNSNSASVRQHLSPWEGYNTVKGTLTKQWRRGLNAVSGDTKKMDSNMRRAQVRLGFEVVKWLFQPQERDQLYRVCMQINEIPLLVSKDKWALGPHGLASGSGWTQLIETVLVMFLLWLNGITASMGIGDDFYFIGNWDPQQVVSMLETVGLPANAEKQGSSRKVVEFLQRMNGQGFFSREDPAILGGYYRLLRALQSNIDPEKVHKKKEWNATGHGSDAFCTRFYIIMENCVDDPGFVPVLLWLAHGQKDLIPFAKKKSDELARIQRALRDVPGLTPSYNQEKRDKPLSSFASIKIVRDRC